MKASKLADLVGKLPGPDRRSGNLTLMDKKAIEEVLAAIHRGGRDNVAGLVGMLTEPGKGDDAKARYALHALAVYVCRLKDKSGRKQFAEALASTLGGDRPRAVQEFIIRQLQVAGDKEVVPALGKLLADERLGEPAAQALIAIRDGAAEQFRKALPRAKGKNRLTVVQALGVLRDAGAALALRKAAADKDRDTRLAALWALANIGDAGSAELLLKAADAREAYERIKATQACLLLAERLQAAGRKKEAGRVYTHLKKTRTGAAEKYVRETAERGLAAVGG
jgi:HEAT repeat protein